MSVNAALQLISTIRSLPPPTRTRGHRDARARVYGAQLADTHSVDTFHEVLAQLGTDRELVDLFACWTHELVMRGAAIGGPHVDALVETLIAIDHPLAQLPLHLLPVETATPSPYGAEWNEMRQRHDMHHATEIPASPDLAAVWEGHCEASNGIVEARAFTIDPPLLRAPDPELLQSLSLRCLTTEVNVKLPCDVARLWVAPFESTFASIMEAATNGGAYSETSRAYGRAYAWRTFTAFAGCSRNTDLRTVSATCERMWWAHFTARNGWFANLAWAMAVAGVSPDGTTLNVIAGTDTD